MDVGLFVVPFAPPGTPPRTVFDWNLDVLKWADDLGFTEAWIGEHFSLPWESVPAPDLLIAASLRETKRIKLAPGAHLLPYHNPAALAHRIAWLDQVAEGRYMLGVGAGAYLSDARMVGITSMEKNGEMMLEALEIMLRLWNAEEAFQFEGKYFKAGYPEYDPLRKGPWLKPRSRPHPPIAMAGLSPRSPTLKMAGQRGYIPLSLFAGDRYVASQWEVYVEGAKSAGRPVPNRSILRVARDVFVADTDQEARRLAVEGGIGLTWREYLGPDFATFGLLKNMIPDPDLPESEITLDYLCEHVWTVGSPDTVVRKLQAFVDESGGFGTLLPYTFDYTDNPGAWRHSMELLAREVAPHVRIKGDRVKSAAEAGASGAEHSS